MSNVLVTKDKLDILANAIANKSGEPLTLTLDEMVEAVDGIETGGITPTGNINITQAGVTDVTNYATATVPEAEVVDYGLDERYVTVSGIRRYEYRPKLDITGGYISTGWKYYDEYYRKSAVPSGTTITPTTSSQTIGGANYMMEGAVTVNAVPSAGEITNYVYISGLAYVLNEDAGTIYIDKTAERTGQICADNSGWIETDQHGCIANSTTTIEVADSYNLPTQSATSITPTESAQTAVAKGKFTTGAVTVSAIPSNYVGSGVTQRSSTDLTVSGATVTAPSGYYSASASKSVASGTAGTPTATKGTVSNHSVSVTPSVTNTTGYITGSTKTGTAVTVSASELVSGSETKTENGTYDVTNLAEIVIDVQGGGSSTISVGKTTRTLASASSSIQFTGLSGNPTSFAVTSSADITTNTNGVTAVVFDGTSLHGQILSTQATADTGFTKSYSGGTLTITATTGTFQANEYKLVYTYGGSTSDIETADIQVGSGATSITFPVTGRPIYWSCVFKSNFSTSSGYQRVIAVGNFETTTYGLCLDSSAHASNQYWTASYSGGNLTIRSQGTNAGGYFHQPGYYQLTYATEGGGGGTVNLQEKTNINPTTSSQTIVADAGYDGLSSVQINAMPSGSAGTPTASKGTVSNHSISVTPSVTNTTGYITGSTKTGTAVTVSASELVSGSETKTANGTYDVTNLSELVVALEFSTIYTGSGNPSSSTGSNGDIYLKVVS